MTTPSHTGALAKKAAPAAASLAATAALSQLLQQLSGHALWVPIQLRVAVGVFTTLLGTTIFFLVRSRPNRTLSEVEKRTRARGKLVKSILCTCGALAMFVIYMWLRASCILSWDPAQWIIDNPHEAANYKNEGLGDFLDVERGEIYIPLFIPKEDRVYIDQVGASNTDGMDGLQWIAQHEPDRLIDWLRVPWRMRLWFTSALFLLVHLLIITLVAMAAAFAGNRLQVQNATVPASPSGS